MRKFSFVTLFTLSAVFLAGCVGAAPTAAIAPTGTAVPNNTVAPTNTALPSNTTVPTNTAAPTETPLPPTATPEPPTATPEPPTATFESPTATPEPAGSKMSWAADGVIGEDEYAHQAETAGVMLYWSNDAEHLYTAISAQTPGWVAVAFDPEQAMMGANYVFGYVQEGELYLEDMYGIKPRGPDSHPPDEQLGGSNDILEAAGREQAGMTVIEFKIPLDSGDQYDKPLAPGASYTVLLAVGGTDDFVSYHAARGATQITLD